MSSDNPNKQSLVRQYWNNRPCNIRHSHKPCGTKEYFDEVESKKYFVEPHIPTFAEFDKWKGKKVLEIGCGIGTDSINFARHGAELTIVEMSEVSLELCKKRFKIFNLKADFYHCDVEKMSSFLPLQNFDLIYSFGVLHHTSNPEKAFEEISKYMGSNTELRIMVYSKISWKLFWLMIENSHKRLSTKDELVRHYSEAQSGCPVTFTYTFSEIKELLKQFDIQITQIYKDHIFCWDIELYKLGIYQKDEYWKDVDEDTFSEFCQCLGWHTMVVGHLSR